MCEMSFFGNSGEVQNASGMCNLPINIINEKIYLIIWVWFLMMIIVTVLVMLAQLCLLLAPYLRQLTLQRSSKSTPAHHIKRLVRRCSYGDYILLQFLEKNLDSSQFDALLSNICDSDALFLSRHSHQVGSFQFYGSRIMRFFARLQILKLLTRTHLTIMGAGDD